MSADLNRNSSRAELIENTVHIAPDGAMFRIPTTWLSWHARHANNIHLTPVQLAEVENAQGDWDADYATVVNNTLPYTHCLAHLGGDGWGRHAASYSDLQMRLYAGTWSLQNIHERISELGASRFLSAKAEVAIVHTTEGPWQKDSIQFSVLYQDYGGTANVELFSQHQNDRTVILVFMYSDYPGVQIDQLRTILQSFEWQAEDK